MQTRNLGTGVRAAAAAAVLGAVVIAGGSWAVGARGEPAAVDDTRTLVAVDHAVTGGELWQATLDALACYQDHGAQTSGPYPASDGLSVDYSVRVSAASHRWERTCTSTLNSLSLRFATDNGPETDDGAPQVDGPEDLPPAAAPRTTEARALTAIRTQLLDCIGAAPRGTHQDEEALLGRIAADEPERFAACVGEVDVEVPARSTSTTADLGAGPVESPCAVPVFPTLGQLPEGTTVEAQPDGTLVSLLVTFDRGAPGAAGPAAHHWVSVEVAAGPTGVGPSSDGSTASVQTGDGEVVARSRVEHRTAAAADDDLWRLDWADDGARVTATAWNVDETDVRVVLRSLRLVDREAFDRYLEAEGLDAVCG